MAVFEVSGSLGGCLDVAHLIYSHRHFHDKRSVRWLFFIALVKLAHCVSGVSAVGGPRTSSGHPPVKGLISPPAVIDHSGQHPPTPKSEASSHATFHRLPIPASLFIPSHLSSFYSLIASFLAARRLFSVR